VPPGGEVSLPPRPDRSVTVHIPLRGVLIPLAVVVAAVTVANVVTQIAARVYRFDVMLGLVRLFYLDAENNVPTWVSSALLLLSALVIAVIAAAAWRARDPFRWHWSVLSVFFCGLSLDETASIHETIVPIVRRVLGVGGFLTNTAWVIPAAAVLLVLVVASCRFLGHLPAATRSRALFALSVLVVGSMGMELVGGAYSYRHGYENLPYALIATVEELLEMAAAILFVRAWLSHLANGRPEIRLVIS
jgi:hypothetical protein